MVIQDTPDFSLPNIQATLAPSSSTDLYAAIAVSASGASTIVSAVASKAIVVRALLLIASAAVNVKLQDHTTPTDLSGLFYLAVNGGLVLPYNLNGWAVTQSGHALDLNLSGAIPVGGLLVYGTV